MRGIAAPLTKLIIFATVTVLATGLLAITIANVDLRGATEYSARFTDATSVNEGDDVRIAGVRVGEVRGVGVVDTTAGLLTEARAPLRNDIAELGKLSKTLGDSNDIVEGVLQRMPNKLETITRTATYGSWFNFFLCGASGEVGLPVLGKVAIPVVPPTQPRCRP